MIKILAIGNSFSQDATARMEELCNDVFVRNLFIGGCTLQRHAENIRADAAAYEYQHNGNNTGDPVSIAWALNAEDWDYVTVQQASGYSGVAESYEPYLTELLNYVRARTKAKIVFHRTWSYEPDSTHPQFADYGCDTERMWQCIQKASDAACRNHGLPVADSGAMIAALRKYDFFNKKKGGLGLCRDGFHMSVEYGRVATACVWIKFFTGQIPAALSAPDRPVGYEYILREL